MMGEAAYYFPRLSWPVSPGESSHVQAIVRFRDHAYPETLSLLVITPIHDINRSGAHYLGSVRARPTAGGWRRPRPSHALQSGIC